MANVFDQFDNPVVSGARDVGTALTLGANDILGITGNVAKIITGKDNFLTEQARKNAEALQLQKSPELIAAEQDRDEAVAAEPNLLYAIGTYVKKTASDPRLFTTTVAQTTPVSIGPGLLGAGARMAAGKLFAKKGAEFATKVGLGTAIGTGIGAQAADVGGQQVDDLLRTLEGMDDQTAMQIPQVADLVKNKGYSIPEAKAAAASYVAMQTAFGAGAISALTQLIPGAQTIEKAIVGGTEKAAGKTLLSKVATAGKGAVKGAAGETLQEVPEEGGGQYLANVLARQIEPGRELTAGVAPAIGQAIVGAGALGGMAGVTQGRPSRPEATPRPVPASQVEAGISDETPAPAATKPSLAPQQQATLERSEEMTPEQFFATVNVRQARLLGGEPNPEDVRLVGEIPPPRAVINPDVMNGALDEAYGALNAWRADNPNAPENIVLIFDPEMLHNGYGIQGAFNPKDGAIFINTAFVAPENIGKIVSHEWAHSTLATQEGRQALADFASREIPQADLDALATRYGTQDRLTLLEEWIAENQEKAPGVISRIVARIREWLSNFGIVNLNDREVADIMLRTLREQAEGKVQPDVDQVGGAVEVDPNSEIYDQFVGTKLEGAPKYALQKLPTAADVTDAKGNLKYTVPKKTLNVSHYSWVPNLTVVDPAYYGTGAGAHYHRMMKGIDKSFFFVGKTKPGENIGTDKIRYQTQIDSSRIYDMDKDVLNLWFAPNPEKSEAILKELGYDGFFAKTNDDRSFVALFYPTDLETGEFDRSNREAKSSYLKNAGYKTTPQREAFTSVAEESKPAWMKNPPKTEFKKEGESVDEYIARVEREEAAERRKALRRASAGKYSLTQEQQPTSGVMASPSITDIDYQRAKKNLRSSDQARFKSEIADYAPGAEIYDAIGDWLDGAENSVAVVYDGPKPVDELKKIAAKAGISGRQKNILWWTADADGTDAIHQVFWPKDVSMDEARQAMIDAGLEARTLMQTPDGIRGLVFDQGRKNLNKIKVLHEHETEPSLDSHNATGDFLGTNWAEEREQRAPRAYGLKAYRGVLGRAAETETGPGRGGPEQRDDLLGRPETEKRFSLAQTKTPEFKAWFGDSQITTPEGTPQVMYHGTYSRKYFLNKFGRKIPVKPDQDFTVFKPSESRGGTIFVSPSPEFASKFAMDTQDLGKKTFFGTTPEQLAEERPGARVYPVFVKSENPFDFENKEHVRRLFGDEEYIEVVPGSKDSDTSDIYGSVDYDGVASRRFDVERGRWEAIENLTEQIKNAGFDGFYVWEEGVKNLGVFNPKQLVSATGNVGAFGQRPVTAEEAQRMGLTEEEAAEAQKRGDIRMSLTEEPVEKTRTEEVEEPILEEGDEGYEEPVDTSSTLSAAAKREREELPPTSALNTLYAKQSAVPLPVTGKRTNGQVAEQLRQAAREYWGRELNSGNLTPDELDRIVGNAVEEVIAGLKAKNHAGNWYTTAIRKAMAIARVIHPELGDDALAQKAGFDDAHAAEVGLAMAMAITSQNLNVEKNTEYANEQFNILKNTGRFDPSKEYGSKLEAISGNLQLANVLLDRVGWKGVEDFLNREYTVKQLNEIASEVLGKPVSISGKVDDVVNGSAIFGPKIGAGFFQNLRGNFNPVTVDLWMRRTWGRWTGDVLPDPLDANRLARMLVGMREGGIQLPEELRSIRTVIAKKGRKVPTLTEDTAERVLSNPEAVNAAYDFAALHDSRWNKIYSEVRQNITPEQAEAVRNGSMSLEQLNRQQQKSIREKQEAWQDLEDRPSVSTKEGKKAQEKFFEEMDREAGRTEKLSNEELSRFKPEWAKAARVIRTLLKPIDAPSDIDRRTIVDVVNRVRSELDRQGINATNADIQAILWYPEKDLWAKLAGKPESKLKSSYDEEFFRVAEARGLGEQARNAAAEVGN